MFQSSAKIVACLALSLAVYGCSPDNQILDPSFARGGNGGGGKPGGGDPAPVWTAEQDLIVQGRVTKGRGAGVLLAVRSGGGGDVTEILRADGRLLDPRWIPDGTGTTFFWEPQNQLGGIFTVQRDPAGNVGAAVRLFDLPNQYGSESEVSADGQAIVYSAEPTPGQTAIAVRQITAVTPGGMGTPFVMDAPAGTELAWPSWSHDSERFAATLLGLGNPDNVVVFDTDPDGNGVVDSTEMIEFATGIAVSFTRWSGQPGDDRVVFKAASDSIPNGDLFYLDFNDQANPFVCRLTNHPDIRESASGRISSDGTRMAYVIRETNANRVVIAELSPAQPGQCQTIVNETVVFAPSSKDNLDLIDVDWWTP